MESLEELIERYGNLKTEVDSYKKQIDDDNKSIKNIMVNEGLSEAAGGAYTVKYSVAVSESFDEEKLIEKLNHLTYKPDDGSFANVLVATGLGIVKMKPYVDMEALENAIYNGKINPVDLADCRITKETPRLTIKKNK